MSASRDSWLVRAPDSWSKGCELESRQKRRENFLSPVLTFCADSYSMSVLPQWHVKDPGYSAKSAGGRLHPNTYRPLTHRSQSGLTMSLSRHSVGAYQEISSHLSGIRKWRNTQPQSSQITEPLWIDPGLKSWISVRELISIKIKKAQAGNEWSNILPKSSPARKKPSPPPPPQCCWHRNFCTSVCVCVCGGGGVLFFYQLTFRGQQPDPVASLPSSRSLQLSDARVVV